MTKLYAIATQSSSESVGVYSCTSLFDEHATKPGSIHHLSQQAGSLGAAIVPSLFWSISPHSLSNSSRHQFHPTNSSISTG
ncbi:hypothetical protein H4Q26_004270 [Puccinia striiformis f. sp. tritici PST-130]|nr:hypothetical protein H4Q26_004270 [Puccinia striiformis f. sp. tritici PST-130]